MTKFSKLQNYDKNHVKYRWLTVAIKWSKGGIHPSFSLLNLSNGNPRLFPGLYRTHSKQDLLKQSTTIKLSKNFLVNYFYLYFKNCIGNLWHADESAPKSHNNKVTAQNTNIKYLNTTE